MKTPRHSSRSIRLLAGSLLLSAPAVARAAIPVPRLPLVPAAPTRPAAEPDPSSPELLAEAPSRVDASPAATLTPANPAPTDLAPTNPAPGSAAPPAAGAASAPGDQMTVGGVTVYGERFTREPDTGLITVTGRPRAVKGPDELRADQLIFHPDTRQFTAVGNVVIYQAGQTVHADRASYNLESQEGEAEHVRELFGQIYVRTERMLLHPGPMYEALNAQVTTCDETPPHYDVYGRHVVIYPFDKLIVERAGFDFLGKRVFTIHRFERSLKPRDEAEITPYPTFGYDSFDGFYAQKILPIVREAPVWINGAAQINTNTPPSGGLLFSTDGNLQIRGSLYYRDQAENQISRFLKVSQAPEVALIWQQGEHAQPGMFLPSQASSMGYPDALSTSTKWIYAGELDGGYFVQYAGTSTLLPQGQNESGFQAKVQGQAILPTVIVGPLNLDNLRFLARQSVYSQGDEFGVFGAGIGKHFKVGKFRIGIDRIDQFTWGRDPFLFDQIELSQEWRPDLEYHSHKFNLIYYQRLRGQNAAFYDQIFEVSYLFHCLEPHISYDFRRGEVLFELRIPGLVSLSKKTPGQPVTEDTGDRQPPAASVPATAPASLPVLPF